MAVNLDYLQKKLNALNEQTAPRQSSADRNLFWKPTGTHVIRIIPYLHDTSDPFRELYFYYNLGDGRRPIPSPITYNLPDPIVEFAKQLQNRGNREDYIMGKKLEPSRRPHAVILLRGDERKGPMYWGFSDTVYKELLAIMLDPDYGDITDPNHGFDITVTFQPATSDGAYPKTTIRPKPRPSIMTEDPEVIKLLQNLPPTEVAFKVPSYDELKTLLEEYLGGADSAANAPSGQADGPKATAPAPTVNTHTTVTAAADAFEQLFKKPGTESPF